MAPLWTDVLMAVSLGLIALATIVGGGAAVVMAVELRRFFRAVERVAGPTVDEVRQLVGTVRTEANALVGTSRDIRTRIVRAADAAEERLVDLDALFDVVQGEVEDTALDVAAAVRDARGGLRLWQWARRLLTAPGNKKKKKKKARRRS